MIRIRRYCLSLTVFLTTSFFVLSVSASTPKKGDAPTHMGLGISANFGKWPNGIVPYVYNPTGAPTGYTNDTQVRDWIESAFNEWTGVCNVSFIRSDGDGDGIDATADITNTNDGIVVIVWDNTIGGAGLAGPFSTSASETAIGHWSYVDGSLRLNPTTFDQTGFTDPFQFVNNQDAFESTVAHEAGHVFGLGHSDKPVSIMYADPYNSLNHIRGDDIESCRAIYGYSDNLTSPLTYVPPGAGSNTYMTLQLSTVTDFPTEITADDGVTYSDNETLLLRWQHVAGYDDRLTMVMVDPHGYRSLVTDRQIDTTGGGAGGGFGNMSFGRLRELPGTWTAYIYDSSGLLVTRTIDVNTNLPVVNAPPDGTLTFSENPATRQVSVTVNVTGDNEGDNATVTWHIPTLGAFDVALGGSSGNDARNVTFNDNLDHEIFVEINDDSTRYDGSTPGGAPAGLGFQRLIRYFSSGRNLGPDLDGDNSADVVWRNLVSGDNYLYGMKGSLVAAGTAINRVSNANWRIVGTGDYNGDGKSDLLWRNIVSGENHMYLMNGAAITSSVFVNRVSNTDWNVVGNGDYNGDGNSDILWRNSVTGDNHMYLMNGPLISSSVPVNRVSNLSWQIVGSGDYNGDGNSDVLWRNSSTGDNWMYLMNGPLIATSSAVNRVSNLDYRIVASGDYDGNGNSDILWRNIVTGDNWMYLMNGTNISGSGPVNRISNLNWTVVGSGDYNADSRSDILLRNLVTGDNQLYLMNSNVIEANLFVNRVSNTNWNIVFRQ